MFRARVRLGALALPAIAPVSAPARTLLAACVVLAMPACARPPAPAERAWRLEPVIELAVPGAAGASVSLAASGANVVAVWAATAQDTTNVYAAVSRDAGATFDAPHRVNDVDGDARAGGEQPPRVAIGRDVVVVWGSKLTGTSRVRMARSTDGGRTFALASTIHDEDVTGARGWTSLAVDRGGVAHVAWLDGRNAKAGHAHGDHGGMRQDILHAAIDPQGVVTEAAVAASVCFCCKTSVAPAPDGAVYVAWRHIYPVNIRDMAVARSDDGGRTFGEAVRVSEDRWQINGCPEDGPSIGVDAAGTVHIAWPTLLEGEPARKAIFYSYSTDRGRTFASRVRIDDASAGRVAAHPQLTVADSGVVIVWEDGEAPSHRARARVVTGQAGVGPWVPVLGDPITVSDAGSAAYPAVAVTPDNIVTAWTVKTGAASSIFVRRLK